MDGYLVYCVFCLLCFLFFLCTVTDFSAAEKDRGVKFCMRVGPLSGQVFSPLVNTGSRGVTVAAAYFSPAQQLLFDSTCGTRSQFDISSPGTCGDARWAVGIGGGGVA